MFKVIYDTLESGTSSHRVLQSIAGTLLSMSFMSVQSHIRLDR